MLEGYGGEAEGGEKIRVQRVPVTARMGFSCCFERAFSPTAQPSQSNPTPRLATVAGANARTLRSTGCTSCTLHRIVHPARRCR